MGEHDCIFSLGDFVDRGPDPFAANDWIAGPDPCSRFALVPRGNHEQMMLEALVTGPPRRRRTWDTNPWSLWEMNGGGWWNTRKPNHNARSWINVLCGLPFCARVETRFGSVGLVHACPVHARWQHLEDAIGDDGGGYLTRARVLWSRVYHGHLQCEIGEKGNEHLGPVEGVRCVVTGRTSVPEPTWHENVLGIDTGVHIDGRGSRPPGRRVACTTAPPRNDARRQVSNALEGFK